MFVDDGFFSTGTLWHVFQRYVYSNRMWSHNTHKSISFCLQQILWGNICHSLSGKGMNIVLIAVPQYLQYVYIALNIYATKTKKSNMVTLSNISPAIFIKFWCCWFHFIQIKLCKSTLTKNLFLSFWRNWFNYCIHCDNMNLYKLCNSKQKLNFEQSKKADYLLVETCTW